MNDTHLGDPRRKDVDDLSFKAEHAMDEREEDRARALFAEAAAIEEAVALEVPRSKPRVRSLLAKSAVSLWVKAEDNARALRLAMLFLADREGLVQEGIEALEELQRLAAAAQKRLLLHGRTTV